MTDHIRVAPQPSDATYDVVIDAGALDHLAELLSSHLRSRARFLISDSNVSRLYAERICKTIDARLLTFPAGERNKTVHAWSELTNTLLKAGAGRDACIIALGGGVTGDLAGFVAATYMRGIPVIQIPTTLLAMIDASIGGKTGVDTLSGKNLVGAFHQPNVVIIDPHVLRTLPDNELRYGLAEAIKHGAIADAEYFHWIASSKQSIFEHKTHTLASLIKRSVEIKAKFVSDDVHESGARAMLNFGHTVAHALEHATSYAIPHGEAVALGMLAETMAAESAGITEQGTSAEIGRALKAVGLPVRLPRGVAITVVIEATRTDKKTRNSAQHFSLVKRIGEGARPAGDGWTWPLPDDVVKEALTRISEDGPNPA